VELHGGNGYCEDWGLTRQLRDAQCHPIWEGSENICVLDVLRAIRREGAHAAVLDRIDEALTVATGGGAGPLAPAAAAIAPGRDRVGAGCAARGGWGPAGAGAGAARVTELPPRPRGAALLAEQGGEDGALAAQRGLLPLRFARRHLMAQPPWADNIAADAGRD